MTSIRNEKLQFLIDEAVGASATLILAHGAGGAMDTEFMNEVGARLASSRINVVRFEFPYMAKRRADGKRRPPDRQPVLLQSWCDAIAQCPVTKKRLFIGGKSMGGRFASMIADQEAVTGLVCMGYPFHPPGKPHNTRVEHLYSLTTPTLILQGERDTFGTPEEVTSYALPASIEFCWLPDGDHGFKPRKRSGFTEQGNLETAITAITQFISDI